MLKNKQVAAQVRPEQLCHISLSIPELRSVDHAIDPAFESAADSSVTGLAVQEGGMWVFKLSVDSQLHGTLIGKGAWHMHTVVLALR